MGTVRSGGGLCTRSPSANLLFWSVLFVVVSGFFCLFVFRVGIFCLLTQLNALETVPVQWLFMLRPYC